MVKLQELLNDFNPIPTPDNGREGVYSMEVDVKGKLFEIEYRIGSIPLNYCLMYASPQEKRQISGEFSGRRKTLDFQFYYVEGNSRSQDVQSFPDGTIFPLIQKIGGFLKNQIDSNNIDTILFGGERDTRERIYDVFAKRISKEPPGWKVVKGYGSGPNGEDGVFWAVLKSGT